MRYDMTNYHDKILCERLATTVDHGICKCVERHLIAALEAELALRTRERDEWRREHDMMEGIAKRYQVALDHIGNNDDADCSLTERQRIRIAREAVRGAGYKD